MEQSTSSLWSIKTQLSLASLMFFGPFIKHLLREEGFDLTEQEKWFVKWYMVLGTINLLLAAICIALGIVSGFFDYSWINVLFVVFSCMLLFILVAWSICIFANISLNKWNNTNLTQSLAQDLQWNQSILFHYLPFVNTYLWYNLHDFDGKHTALKESQIIWMIFGLVCFTGNLWIIWIILALIIVRMVSLTVIWDLLPKLAPHTEDLFHKNIEEIWGWIWGRLLRSIGKVFKRNKDLSTTIADYKSPYSYLYDIKKYWTIQRQYVIALLLYWYVIVSLGTSQIEFIILGIALILGRYCMMVIVWWHIPPLPLIDDVFRGIKHRFQGKKPSVVK